MHASFGCLECLPGTICLCVSAVIIDLDRARRHHVVKGEDRFARLELGNAHARALAIDVLACPHCGGRLRLIATLHDPAVIRKILAHLGIARAGPSPGPAPPEFGAAC
jgi:hypothetical protein